MPRVLPSQVVDYIDRVFPDIKTQRDSKEKSMSFGRDQSHIITTIVALTKKIPEEFLTLESQDYAALIASLSYIEFLMQYVWPTRNYALDRIPGFGFLNPITLIRNALAKCPDEAPSPKTTELDFIEDPDYRNSLRLDISTANKAFSNGEWKAATVLSGSVVETLLLWALRKKAEKLDFDLKQAIDELKKSRAEASYKPATKLDDWNLHQYIDVAEKLELINKETAIQSRLAKDYRNLIHPGLEVRSGQKCNRGIAATAIAAIEHVVEDLKVWKA